MNRPINPAIFQQHIKTSEDATYFLAILSNLSGELFKKDRTLEQILDHDISYQRGLTIKKIALSHHVDLHNANDLINFFNQLADTIKALPMVHITLALAPKEQLVTTMSQWFMVNFQKLVILDITVDRSLLAGGIISFGGKREDYSLRQELFKETQAKE